MPLPRASDPLASDERARELAQSQADDAIGLPEFIELTGVGAGHYSMFQIGDEGVELRDVDTFYYEDLSPDQQLEFLRAREGLRLRFPCSVAAFMSWYDRTRGEKGVSDFPIASAFERALPSPGEKFSPIHGAAVPSASIVAAFQVGGTNTDNASWWDDKMRNAKRNGLVIARVARGRGRVPAFWAPLPVAAWLVEKRYMKKGAARRVLQEHFRDADADLLGA